MFDTMNPKTITSTEDDLKTKSRVGVRDKYSCRSACAQLLATLIQALLLVDLGMEQTIPTLIIGALHKNSAEALQMDDDEASWVGSVSMIVGIFGSILSGFLQELLGRKGLMMFVNVPRFASWMTLYFAETMSTLNIAVFVLGLSGGLCEASIHSYLGEIGDPRFRGTLASVSTQSYFVGVLIIYMLGYYFEWRRVVLISSACPAFAFICMTQVPESPTWLIVQNRLDEAKRSLCWVRGWITPNEVEEEFHELVNYVKNSSAESQGSSSSKNLSVFQRYLSMMKVVMSKKVLRPLRMTCLAFLITAVAGTVGLTPFLIRELKELGTTVDPKLILVMSQILLSTGSIMNAVFLRRFGKRKMCLYSVGLAALSMVGIATFCSLSFGGSTERNPQLSWIPVSLFCFLNFINGIGIGLLPWQLITEVFPPVGRGFASGISVAFGNLFCSGLTMTFLHMEAWIHLSGVMYFYAGITVLGFLYYYFYLPETEGKTLEHIEAYFTKDHDRSEKFKMGKHDANFLG